jgi:hypothetical protein
VDSNDEKPELTEADVIKALLQNQMEENAFVRHYEETRFKITQMTITLSGLLIGALRFGNSQQHSSRLLGVFIIILGVLGVLISAKYTERADRHASLSRAYRRAASDLFSKIGNYDLEKIHESAALKHRNSGSITGLLHDVRARLFWMGIHLCMVVLGLFVALS